MIDETFSRIEARLKSAGGLNPDSREELITLIGSLKTEVSELAKNDAERASDISRLTETSATAATHDERDEKSVASATQSLESTVQEFEAQHPQLVERVNRLCVILSNMGI